MISPDGLLGVAPFLAAAAKAKPAGGSPIFFFVLIAVVFLGYRFWYRPQMIRAKSQRQTSTDIAVGDEVLTIGGIVGVITELSTDRVTILSGIGNEGSPSPSGDQSTRIVLLRSGIARKIEPEVAVDEEGDTDESDDSSYEEWQKSKGDETSESDTTQEKAPPNRSWGRKRDK